MDEQVKLCEVCWKKGFAARAHWYLSTIPVCDGHYGSVCARCQRRWAKWLCNDGQSEFFACSECAEKVERELQRRAAYNRHLGSEEWRKTKKTARQDSYTELGKVACSRCGMSESDNKRTYGEGLHGHHVTYERFGHEKSRDVQLLCSSCHAWEHGSPEPKRLKTSYEYQMQSLARMRARSGS